MRRPGVVVGTAFVTVLALLVALGLILFSVNPGVNRNEGEIKRAVTSQHAIICAQVQNTANAYRFRSLTPSGKVEPIRHFLTRMQAQQQTLRLAQGSKCKSAPGFLPVGIQVRRALNQIKRILEHFGPKLKRPVDRRTSGSYKQAGSPRSISRPSKAGIGDEGVPSSLKPELAPSAPTSPQGGSPGETPAHKVTPAPEVAPVPPEAPIEQTPEVAGEEGATRVEEKVRPELPTAPIPPVEIHLELP